MSEIHIGPHTRDHGDPAAPGDTKETFDREINLKAIAWTVGGLIAVTVVVYALVWGVIEGFEGLEEKRDPRPTPIEAAFPQGPPPEPRLQVAPEEDLRALRAEEDTALHKPAWVNRGQGTARVPIDVAMEVIARRGLGADVVGGQPGASAATPEQMRRTQAQTSPGAPGATVQMTRPVVPAQPGAQPGSPPAGSAQRPTEAQRPPVRQQERR